LRGFLVLQRRLHTLALQQNDPANGELILAWNQFKGVSSYVKCLPQWDVPEVAGKSRDLQGKSVGSLGGGAIGSLVMERLKVIPGPELSVYTQW